MSRQWKKLSHFENSLWKQLGREIVFNLGLNGRLQHATYIEIVDGKRRILRA